MAAYQRTYPTLTQDQAIDRVRTQEDRIWLRERLQEQFADVYAGAEFDPLSGVLRLRTTSERRNPEIEQLARTRSLKVNLAQARRTLSGLEALHETVLTRVPLLSELAQGRAYVDEHRNEVAVALTATDLTAWQASGRVPPDGVRVHLLAPTPETVCINRESGCGTPLRSGIGLWQDYQSDVICSWGATAREAQMALGGPSLRGICVRFNATVGHGGQYIGPVRDNPDNDVNTDVSRARVDNLYWRMGGYMYNSANPEAPVDVDGVTLSNSARGDVACISAKNVDRARRNCGIVYDNFPGTGFLRVDIGSCLGDSGGLWYWLPGDGRRIAYGIQKGGITDSTTGCYPDSGFSYFTTIYYVYKRFDFTTEGSGHVIRIETR